MNIVVINAGSSSLKGSLYTIGESLPEAPLQPCWEGEADWSKQEGTVTFAYRTARREHQMTLAVPPVHQEVLTRLFSTLWEGPDPVLTHPDEIDVVGHRIVHGGADYQQAVRITPEVKAVIQECIPLAPLHNPAGLEGIVVSEQLFPGVPNIAVFDTAFHRQMPLVASIYPGPYRWFEQGIRRYGFHGINHQYCATRTAQILQRDEAALRLITCHLGNGCSLAAIAGGRCQDTTMGFTPLDGIMMGTRPGSLDPGILIYLMRHTGSTADQLDHALNEESGLKGVSGLTNDMRQILQASREGNKRAQLAFDLFIHRLRAGIGEMLATLGGVDALVFSGGIGEHAAEVRARACEAFAFLGLELDSAQNSRVVADQDIATPASTVRVVVVRAQEAWAIAQECWRLMARAEG